MKKALLLIGVCLPLRLLLAQGDPPPLIASGEYENDFYKWSFSVGDIAIWTFHTPQNYWSQGSQQPIITLVATNEPEDAAISVTLFPNPTSDLIYCSLKSKELPEKIRLEIWNAAGQLLKPLSTEFQTDQTISIPVGNLPAGQYTIRFINTAGQTISKSFIKTSV